MYYNIHFQILNQPYSGQKPRVGGPWTKTGFPRSPRNTSSPRSPTFVGGKLYNSAMKVTPGSSLNPKKMTPPSAGLFGVESKFQTPTNTHSPSSTDRLSEAAQTVGRASLTGAAAVGRASITGVSAIGRASLTGAAAVGRASICGLKQIGRASLAGVTAVGVATVNASGVVATAALDFGSLIKQQVTDVDITDIVDGAMMKKFRERKARREAERKATAEVKKDIDVSPSSSPTQPNSPFKLDAEDKRRLSGDYDSTDDIKKLALFLVFLTSVMICAVCDWEKVWVLKMTFQKQKFSINLISKLSDHK